MKDDNPLTQFRKEIDAIDVQIFDLLLKRLAIVKKVGQHKKSYSDKNIIRPFREAAMTEKIYQDALASGLPKHTAEGISYIWRVLIATAVMFEEDTKIATIQAKPNDKAYIEQYFTPFAYIENFKDISTLLEIFINNKANILAADIYAKHEYNGKLRPLWYIILRDKALKDLKIFAKLSYSMVAGRNSTSKMDTTSNLFCLSNIEVELGIQNDIEKSALKANYFYAIDEKTYELIKENLSCLNLVEVYDNFQNIILLKLDKELNELSTYMEGKEVPLDISFLGYYFD